MYPPPNCTWRCQTCGHEERHHKDDPGAFLHAKKCPLCNCDMENVPDISTGPWLEDDLKQY